ncbi:hypothetical protein [Variovorax ginsengisoli]|uniref:Uncharacterized protein n=1 Tax=Variovorax ginsengisoli TaxID=363844 RepID=A0ABT9S587_9BURK|nr:hypothetical protein [Variovorax ginsengisoli]MDP9899516.1 hypothetical protein [Variovorax ginsengisoli]
MNQINNLIFTLALLITSTAFALGQPAKNYIYLPNREANGPNVRAEKALFDSRFSGAQIVYAWRSLEPVKDQYDFSAIKQDFGYLSSINKKLWIQLQEKSFQTNRKNVPNDLLLDPIYKGGVLKQSMLSASERDPKKPETDDEYRWSAKMWEKPVRDRFQKLIAASGKELDGQIEGMNFSESPIEIGIEQPDGTTVSPKGF